MKFVVLINHSQGSPSGGREGVVLNRVLYREPMPWGTTPYPFIYPFWQQRWPFHICIPSNDKWYPFHIPSLERLCIPFNCCKCTVFKIWINHKTRTSSQLFHSHKIHFLVLLQLFRAIFVWPWKMVSISVRHLFHQPMGEKIKTWTLRFPAKETLIWRRHCSIGQ